MKIKSIRWGLVLSAGWFVILVAAAIILPPIDSRTIAESIVPILALVVVWLLLTGVALCVYFYRGWKRAPSVPNRVAYTAWLSVETAFALAVVGVLVWVFVPDCMTTPWRARERALRQDLITMRAIIDQYTLDKQKPPLSLDDLVTAGYLKELPTDPLTGRKDTWVVKCSNARSAPGIVDIDSGYDAKTNKGTLNCE